MEERWRQWADYVMEKLENLEDSVKTIQTDISEMKVWMSVQDERWAARSRQNAKTDSTVESLEERLHQLETKLLQELARENEQRQLSRISLDRASLITAILIALMAFGSMVTSLIGVILR